MQRPGKIQRLAGESAADGSAAPVAASGSDEPGGDDAAGAAAAAAVEPAGPAAALLLLHGSAGIYEIAIEFAGVSRIVMLDTGSPLSWVPEAITDRHVAAGGATIGS